MAKIVNTQLAQAANEFVNQVFYGPMMKSFRESQNNPYFGNGPGGKTFVNQLDMELLSRMSAGKPTPIAQALIDQLEKNMSTQQTMQKILNDQKVKTNQQGLDDGRNIGLTD